MIAQTVR